MNFTRRDILALSAAGIAGSALAQGGYPSKPIRILVPNPAGGGSDITARLLAEKLGKSLGQPVIVENKAGGNSAVAAGVLVASEADGYTLLYGLSGVVQNPWLVKNLPYKLEQLAPVSLFARIPVAFAVSPSLNVNNLHEFIALAKAKPHTLSYASYGIGSSAHAFGEMLNRSAGISLLHVPYKGEQPALTDLMAGVVSSAFAGPGAALQYEKANKLKIIALAGATRSPLLPNVPTFIEAGIPEIEEAGWSGIFASAGTPRPIIERLGVEIAKAIRQPDLNAKIAEFFEPVGSTPQEFAVVVRRDYERWGRIFKTIGLERQ
jgi:tripartite-type tricarboxylate transporter receptor subunit TctC